MEWKMEPLSEDILADITGGMTADTVDMKTLVIKLAPKESAAAEMQKLLVTGIKFMGMSIAISDEQGKLMAAAAELDRNSSAARSCIVRFNLVNWNKAVISRVQC